VVGEMPVKTSARHTERIGDHQHAHIVKTAFDDRLEGSIEPIVAVEPRCL